MSIRKKLALIVAIVILAGLFWGLGNQVISSLQGGNRLDMETENLLKLQKQNAELKKKLNEAKSLQSIEKVARDKLNLSREGETVVIISGDAINKALKSWEEKKEAKIPNWQGWLKLFWK